MQICTQMHNKEGGFANLHTDAQCNKEGGFANLHTDAQCAIKREALQICTQMQTWQVIFHFSKIFDG